MAIDRTCADRGAGNDSTFSLGEQVSHWTEELHRYVRCTPEDQKMKEKFP
jgi:hypothetical protein